MKDFLRTTAFVGCVLLATAGVLADEPPPSGSRWSVDAPDVRARFVAALQDIEADWFADERPSTAAEVLAILGPPDDIIYRHEHAGGLVQRKEIWGYGTNGHLTLATLGTVTIGLNDRVIDVTGGSVHPLPPGPTFAEPAVRSFLRDIHRLDREGRFDPFRGRSFHPREMIVLVNELRDLGKSSALGLLREYARINSSHHGLDGGAHVIAILRFLFEPPQDMLHPKTYLPFEEHKNLAHPAIPAAVIEGTPLLLFPLGSYSILGGLPEPGQYLPWYERHGVMRKRPLRPPDDPRQVWSRWTTGLRAEIADRAPDQASEADVLVKGQLLRLIETVHPRAFDDDVSWRRELPVLWANAMATLARSPTRWDDTHDRYVRAHDGTSIEPTQETDYRRVFWRIPTDDRMTGVTLHRVSDTWVRVHRQELPRHTPLPRMTVRIVRADDAKVELASVGFGGASGRRSSFRLQPGDAIRCLTIVDGRVVDESTAISLDVPVAAMPVE